MNLKFSLLDEDDLKQIETMLVRAGLRIFRQLAREGLLTPQVAAAAVTEAPRVVPRAPPARPPSDLPRDVPTSRWPVETALPPEPPPPPVAGAPPAVAREIPTSLWPAQPVLPPEPPEPVPWEQPAVDEEEEDLADELARETAPTPPAEEKRREAETPRFMRPPPPGPLPPRIREVPPPPAKVAKKKYRSVQQVCKTVAERPFGYISTNEAYELIGGNSPSGALSQYINNKEVAAVIVASIKPPTKGLPGRLMVSKDSLMKRLEVREKNKKLPATQRETAPQVDAQI